ncbi:MAG: hypothetical protein ACOCRK_02285 [bacterium]
MICPFCSKKINRETIINGKVIERSYNIYGTWCPYCHKFIKPNKSPKFLKEINEKEQELKNRILNKIKGQEK